MRRWVDETWRQDDEEAEPWDVALRESYALGELHEVLNGRNGELSATYHDAIDISEHVVALLDDVRSGSPSDVRTRIAALEDVIDEVRFEIGLPRAGRSAVAADVMERWVRDMRVAVRALVASASSVST